MLRPGIVGFDLAKKKRIYPREITSLLDPAQRYIYVDRLDLFGSAPACAPRSRASIMDGTPPTLPYLTSVHGYMLSVVVVEPTYVRPGLKTGKSGTRL